MKRSAMFGVAAFAVVMSSPGLAVDQVVRLGPSAGFYHQQASLDVTRDNGTSQPGDHVSSNQNEFAYGGTLGYAIVMGDFFGDVGLDLLRGKIGSDTLDRTDLLATVGYFVAGSKWSVFGGLRRGWQGKNFFNDEAFKEIGPFVGVGYSGLQLGGDWGLDSLVAYNFDKVKDFAAPGRDLDYPGVNLKLRINKSGSPHAFQLRAQRFSGDDNIPVTFSDTTTGRFAFDLQEIYVMFSYLYLFRF